jgi:hypothetical protein
MHVEDHTLPSEIMQNLSNPLQMSRSNRMVAKVYTLPVHEENPEAPEELDKGYNHFPMKLEVQFQMELKCLSGNEELSSPYSFCFLRIQVSTNLYAPFEFDASRS